MAQPSSSGNPRHSLGERAEGRVAEWLAAHGWTVLARRLRTGRGELDIVALDPDEVLVGVEVRARRSVRTGAPAETLGARDVARRRRALAAYAAQAPPHRGLRLDLVAAVQVGPMTWRLSRHIGIDTT